MEKKFRMNQVSSDEKNSSEGAFNPPYVTYSWIFCFRMIPGSFEYSKTKVKPFHAWVMIDSINQ